MNAPKHITAQRIYGFLLVCLQAVALGYLSRSVVFPAVAVLVALTGVVSKRRFHWTREQLFTVTAVLAVLFLVKYSVAPPKFRFDALFIRTQLAYSIAQFLLTLQALWFLVRTVGQEGPNHERTVGRTILPVKTSDDRLPLKLAGLAAILMVCIADIQVTDRERRVFQVMVLGFAVLAALYFGACRKRFRSMEVNPRDGSAAGRKPFTRVNFNPRYQPRSGGADCDPRGASRGRIGRAVAGALVLTVSTGLAAFASSSLYRHERSLEQFVARFLEPRQLRHAVGFSGVARLGSLMRQKTTDEEYIALRVASTNPPGYLRGKAFDALSRSQWTVEAERRVLRPLREPAAGIPAPTENQQLVRCRRPRSAAWRVQTFWPDEMFGGLVFTSLGATHLETDIEEITVDRHGIFACEGAYPGSRYVAYAHPEQYSERLSDEMRARLTELPPELRGPGVRQLADRVFAKSRTTQERLDAVTRYFQENHEYNLEIAIPEGFDPLLYFLLVRPAAHCEYFASGAAVLLRTVGIPCRYVTGFLPTEYNEYGTNWIARNRDAHAWVEAYEEQTGTWKIVEASPLAARPQPVPPSKAVQLWEFLRGRFVRYRFLLQQRGLGWIVSAGLGLLASPPGLVLLAVLAVVVWFRRKPRLQHRHAVDPTLERLRALLDEMDARAKKHSLQRRPGETLHQFAQRILAGSNGNGPHRTLNGEAATLAEWYRRYAAVRYSGDIDDAAVEQLQQALR